jgi:catalase
MASVLYDAVVVPGGIESVSTLSADGYALHFVAEAVKHAKAVAALGDGTRVLERVVAGAVRVSDDSEVVVDQGVVSTAGGNDQLPAGVVDAFTAALAEHRAWQRSRAGIPA